MGKNDRKTHYIALGGVLAALSLVLMLLSAVVPIAELVLPAMAGILLICAVCEMGEGWAFLIFVAVGLLSILLLPSKSTAIYYIFFLGHYPILKSFIERIKNKPLQWAAKLVLFNICAAASLYLVITFFGVPQNMFKYGGYPVLALILNAAFVIYDIALSGLVAVYVTRLKKILNKH